MKHITFIILIVSIFAFVSCGRNGDKNNISVDEIRNPASPTGIDNKASEEMPILTFETLKHDFGRVIQGEKLSYTFKFKNTGKSSLIISGVDASCSCTTTSPPKAPIKPGESGEIKVSFDSKTKKGDVMNHVVVYSNTYPNSTVLSVVANVVTP